MNKFVFADPNLCIGCTTCTIACVISHQEDSDYELTAKDFVPRLTVIKNVDVSTPVLCRQCDDAPCAQVCPNNAIISEDNHIKVIQERCIGCKTCVVACPYGAMTVVTNTVEKESESSLFKSEKQTSQALKCDLCAHSEAGPACVRVCPTNALRLVTPDDLEQMNKKKQLAAACAAGDVISF
ncbi:4Fe-4S dicluster domain-containing protein [Vibrio sp. S11_S32]|uniref:4Fe-4S binding protein n=1 Tax=Vibrio sp. S11_S32 TaxID=2720225 RepID=UPI001680E57C|nr:4Fe-4S dicluster domain-containing protein [Vibrio sp. S11_S32]MBD1577625.1 4Fe-4S dicluster domain-containing protein [Vibrio sp. S11_S32]